MKKTDIPPHKIVKVFGPVEDLADARQAAIVIFDSEFKEISDIGPQLIGKTVQCYGSCFFISLNVFKEGSDEALAEERAFNEFKEWLLKTYGRAVKCYEMFFPDYAMDEEVFKSILDCYTQSSSLEVRQLLVNKSLKSNIKKKNKKWKKKYDKLLIKYTKLDIEYAALVSRINMALGNESAFLTLDQLIERDYK